jgi:hypothetical protein
LPDGGADAGATAVSLIIGFPPPGDDHVLAGGDPIKPVPERHAARVGADRQCRVSEFEWS